jgi:hypothetical protein
VFQRNSSKYTKTYNQKTGPRYIRVRNKLQKYFEARILLRKLDNLWLYLSKICLILVQQIQADKGYYNDDDKFAQEFLQKCKLCFYEQLFGPQNGLPVFQIVENINLTIDTSMFEDIQILFINYFRRTEAYKVLPDFLVSLFRDWYNNKTHDQCQWGIFFEDEDSISPTFIDLLERNHNYLDGFWFNSFMLKTKFDPSELKKKHKLTTKKLTTFPCSFSFHLLLFSL